MSDLFVYIRPAGIRADAENPDEAIHLARDLLEEARKAGHRVPRADFFVDGRLVRGSVTRTDLAKDFGVCWCGRGALRVKDDVPFCCSAHEVLWDKWSPSLRARTIVAQFISIYGRGRR